jgi:hypothetical protein
VSGWIESERGEMTTARKRRAKEGGEDVGGGGQG